MLKTIERSLFERARHFVQVRRAKQLASELRLPQDCTADVRTLELLASVKVHLTTDVDLLVDVGTHKGGFAAPAFHALGAREIICFEPNAELRAAVETRLQGVPSDLRWVALSDEPGNVVFHVHQDPSMSSLMAADPVVLQRDFATYDGRVASAVEVEVSTLDVQLSAAVRDGRDFFLKLDTQGNELAVLRGGAEVLRRCTGVLTEFMFTTPYQEQSSFEELTDFMKRAHFRCAAIVSIMRRPSHRVSAVDLLFLPTHDD